MKGLKLLVVEDDPNLGQILTDYLGLKGFETDWYQDGQSAWDAYKKSAYDLCLLDVMMPKMDGFTLAEKIRHEDQHTPIIFLTAKSLKEDAIAGLKIGADDYMTKPFSMEELLLRINAVMRRVNPEMSEEDAVYELGKYTFDTAHHLLKGPEEEQKLTSKEAELLSVLCQNMNRTVDRNWALKKIWKDDSYFNARSMDVYISKLRKYLSDEENLKIVTIHGKGFKLVFAEGVTE